jgi:TIR domain
LRASYAHRATVTRSRVPPSADVHRSVEPAELFISYASADLAHAEALHRHLAAAGFGVWFDRARLNPGCDRHREIEAGCNAARLVLPLVTPH